MFFGSIFATIMHTMYLHQILSRTIFAKLSLHPTRLILNFRPCPPPPLQFVRCQTIGRCILPADFSHFPTDLNDFYCLGRFNYFIIFNNNFVVLLRPPMAPSCLPLPRTLCPSPLPLLLSLSVVVSLHAYPSFYLAPNSLLPFRQLHPSASSSSSSSFRPSKRAFDRLDVSPFDFDAMTKRFDEELSALPFDGLYLSDSPLLRKRAFDRLEDSGFFGQKRKRVFDRLDTSFMLAKRRK